MMQNWTNKKQMNCVNKLVFFLQILFFFFKKILLARD